MEIKNFPFMTLKRNLFRIVFMAFVFVKILLWKGAVRLITIDFDKINEELVYEAFGVDGNEAEALCDAYLELYVFFAV